MLSIILKRFWKGLLIIALLIDILAGVKWILLSSLIKENQRVFTNYEQLIIDNDSKVLDLTSQKFKEFYAKQDTLFNELKDYLKLKNIYRKH